MGSGRARDAPGIAPTTEAVLSGDPLGGRGHLVGPGMPEVLTVVGEPGVTLVEGHPDEPLLLRPADASQVIEACISADTDAALLYPRKPDRLLLRPELRTRWRDSAEAPRLPGAACRRLCAGHRPLQYPVSGGASRGGSRSTLQRIRDTRRGGAMAGTPLEVIA